MVVVLIVGILVSIAVAVYASPEEKTKSTVCAEHRARIDRVYIAYHVSNPSCGSHQFLDGKCEYFKDTLDSYTCPSKGTYSYNPAGRQVICSIHGPKPGEAGPQEEDPPVDNGPIETPGPGGGSGGGGNPAPPKDKVPGTDIDLVPSYWPKPEDFVTQWSNITVAPGGVFKHTDGKYYVVVRPTTVTKGQAGGGPGGVVYGWYNTPLITGDTITYSSGQTQVSTAKRGDLCVVDGHTYVWIDGGSWATRPDLDPRNWYKLQ